MNVTLDKFLEELKVKGFEPRWYDYLDYYLIHIDLYNNIEQHITLEVCYTEEYEEELRSLPEGTEINPDYSRMECTGAFLECVICYPEGPVQGTSGITVYDMDYFWKAFELFQNPSKAKKRIMSIHLQHSEYIEKHFVPILEKYDFYNNYDSYWDCSEKTYIGAQPIIGWKYKYSSKDIDFKTDMLTEKLYVNGDIWNEDDDFEKWLIDNVMTYKHGPETFYELEFERFFSEDSKWTPTSHQEILMLSDNIRRLREDKNLHYNDINFDAIPKKYEYLIDQYNELCKK